MSLNFEIIGIWFVILMTLSIFSYLVGDNPFYKLAEHIFIGVSAAYIFAITFWDQIYPNLLGRLFPKYINAGYDLDLTYIIPLILGIFMLFRLIPSLSWLSRISIGYIVGMGAGLKFYAIVNSNILTQIKSSAINFNSSGWEILNQIIIQIPLICIGGRCLPIIFFKNEDQNVILWTFVPEVNLP